MITKLATHDPSRCTLVPPSILRTRSSGLSGGSSSTASRSSSPRSIWTPSDPFVKGFMTWTWPLPPGASRERDVHLELPAPCLDVGPHHLGRVGGARLGLGFHHHLDLQTGCLQLSRKISELLTWNPTSAGRGKLAKGNSPLPRSRRPLRADEPKVSLGLIWRLLDATSIYVWLGFEVNRWTQSVLGIDLIIWRLLDVTSIYVWHEIQVDSRWAQIVLGIDLIIC